MRAIWTAGIIWLGMMAGAHAQAVQPGLYDGRSIEGWTYSAERSSVAGLPTWVLTQASGDRVPVNCNIGTSPMSGSLSQWQEYFATVTPQSFMQELRSAGTDATAGYLTEVVTLNDRLALRNLLAANASGQRLEFMIVTISGADTLTTLTCTAFEGQLLPLMTEFYRFADQMRLDSAPAR